MNTLFYDVKRLYTKFGMAYNGNPRELDHKELAFRLQCLEEEQNEYIDAESLAQQYDALLDLIIFAAGTIERQGFKHPEEAMARVMRANMRKQRALTASDSKRNFAVDLVKPAGWREPYLGDLSRVIRSEARGLILLDGPDHCGKSTLADYMRVKYDAHVVHSTWSPEIAKNMFNYLHDTLYDAIEISKNQLVILDRSWISDYIYSEVYRGGATLLANDYKHLQQVFVFAGGVGCICFPGEKHKWHAEFTCNANTRGEMYLEKMDEVYDAYEHLFTGVGRVPFKNAYAEQLRLDGGFLSGLDFRHYDYLEHLGDEQIKSFGAMLSVKASQNAKTFNPR